MAIFNKGNVLSIIGKDKEALEYFERAMKINPEIKKVPNELELISKGVSLDRLADMMKQWKTIIKLDL